MDDRTRSLVGDLVILAGLVLFVVGATAIVWDYPLGVPLPVLGALALLLVGLGAATRRGGMAGPR